MEKLQGIEDQLIKEFEQLSNQRTRRRYVFEKYDSRVGKRICPKCGEKTFVFYVDTWNSNQIVNKSVGKCERINECKYWKTPYDFFNENHIVEPYQDKWLEHFNADYIDDTINIELIDKKLCDFIHKKYLKSSLNNPCNTFSDFLLKYLNNDYKALYKLILLYNIGSGYNDDVIFWQQDIDMKLRTGKIMHFNDKGKRYKKYTDWVHMKIGVPDFNVRQCLYGEHLLNTYPSARQIIVVESEKSAIIVKNEYLLDDNIIVMATGGMEGLTIHKFRVFEDLQKEITIIPDIGAEDDWRRKMNLIKNNLKLDIELVDANQFIMRFFNDDFTLENGEDIADYLIYKKLGIEYITE